MRYAPALFVASLAAGSIAAFAAPAQATNCSAVFGGFEYANGYVVAEKYRQCQDEEGTVIPQATGVQQKSASGAWITVASGTGVAAYKCVGTATKRYRQLGSSTNGTAYPCG